MQSRTAGQASGDASRPTAGASRSSACATHPTACAPRDGVCGPPTAVRTPAYSESAGPPRSGAWRHSPNALAAGWRCSRRPLRTPSPDITSRLGVHSIRCGCTTAGRRTCATKRRIAHAAAASRPDLACTHRDRLDRRLSCGAARFAAQFVARAGGAGAHTHATQAAPPSLRPIDSVRIAENDSLLLSRPNRIVVGSRGDYFVVDGAEARVLEITSAGRIVRTFGRKGSGPGEFQAPGSSAVQGDTLLAVMDVVLGRVALFDLRTGKYESGFPLRAGLPRPNLRIGALVDFRRLPRRRTSLTRRRVLVQGRSRQCGGNGMPALLRHNPQFVGCLEPSRSPSRGRTRTRRSRFPSRSFTGSEAHKPATRFRSPRSDARA